MFIYLNGCIVFLNTVLWSCFGFEKKTKNLEFSYLNYNLITDNSK